METAVVEGPTGSEGSPRCGCGTAGGPRDWGTVRGRGDDSRWGELRARGGPLEVGAGGSGGSVGPAALGIPGVARGVSGVGYWGMPAPGGLHPCSALSSDPGSDPILVPIPIPPSAPPVARRLEGAGPFPAVYGELC